MAQRIRVHGRVKDIEVKQTSDYEGNQHQEARITFATNATPKKPNYTINKPRYSINRPNRPSYTINRPSYTIKKPRQPNGIRYNVGDQHAKTETNTKQTEA